MIFLPFLAAAAMSVPDAELDFSRRMLPSKPDGNVFADLLVGPDGRVERCKVIYSEGSTRDDERYCQRTIGLESGEPARGPDGNPAYGVARFDLIVRPVGVRNVRVPTRPPDIELTVGSLPEEFGSKLKVAVVIFVSESGAVLNCERYPSTTAPASYASAACQQLRQMALPVMQNQADVAVAYVVGLDVDFVVETPAP
jgi:hypothetical protein